MKRPNSVRQQLVAGTVGAWVLLFMRLGFNAFPEAAPTYILVTAAFGMSGLLYIYPRLRDAAPGVMIRPTPVVKVGMAVIIVCAAGWLARYVVSRKGAPLPRLVIVLGALFLAFLGLMQWLTDRSQF